jgi:putative nucleotidyltransferase-like protein
MVHSAATHLWRGVFLRACAVRAPGDWAGQEGALWGLDPEDWNNIVSVATRHGLIGLVSRGLDFAYQQSGVSSPARERLAQWRQGQLIQLLRRRKLARQVAEAFKAANIDFILYKGVALADEVYGDLSLRGFGDCDILVRPDSIDAAFAKLTELGYTAGSTTCAQQIANGINAIAVKRPDASVDLHWSLSVDELFLKDADIIWAHSEPPRIPNALPGRRMSPELNLVNLASHFCRHSFLELKPLVDFHVAATKYGAEVDVDVLRRLARLLDAELAVDLTARLSQTLLLPDPAVARLVHDRPALRTRIGCAVLTERSLVRTGDPPPTESRLRRLMLSGTSSSAVRAFRKMLLPRVSDLESRFQRPFDLRMYPQYYVIQARRVLTRSKRSFDGLAGLPSGPEPPDQTGGT